VAETRIPPTHVAPPVQPAGPDGATPTVHTESVPYKVSEVRKFLLSRGNSSIADAGFHWLMVLCALSIFGIVVLIATELVRSSHMSWAKFGFSFFIKRVWDPVNGDFGALPFLYGTIVTSLIALVIAVPLAIGVAIFLTEMCPKMLRGPLAFVTELLAAIPSIIYGLWAVFILVPLMRDHVNPILIRVFGWTTLFDGDNLGLGFLTAGVILAVMILPIISSLTREVMTAVPHSQREAVLALGATRWEMIRVGVLRNARIGIVGSIILGLGRALGETMAVTMVIGNQPAIQKSFLAAGSTMASVIANEFSEASDDLHLSALIEIGLALFIVTILVNALARVLVWAVTRGAPARVN
jgi:phosphate transport system permease protein